MFVTYHLTPWGRTLLTPRAESFLSLSLILTRCRSVSHTLSLPCNSCLSLTPPVLEPWESFITWSVTALLVSGVKPFVLFISPVPLFPCPRFTSSLSASISLPFPPHFHLHAYLYKKKKKTLTLFWHSIPRSTEGISVFFACAVLTLNSQWEDLQEDKPQELTCATERLLTFGFTIHFKGSDHKYE